MEEAGTRTMLGQQERNQPKCKNAGDFRANIQGALMTGVIVKERWMV